MAVCYKIKKIVDKENGVMDVLVAYYDAVDTTETVGTGVDGTEVTNTVQRVGAFIEEVVYQVEDISQIPNAPGQ